jgi:hypothetical protein
VKLWPSRRQWESWSLPSKLSAIGVLIGLLSLVVTAGIYAYPVVAVWLQPPIPPPPWPPKLSVRISNPTGSNVTIKKTSRLFVTKEHEGTTTIDLIPPEECQLLSRDGHEIGGDLIEIAPGESAFEAEIPAQYLRVLRTGEWDVFMGFDSPGGKGFASESIPFAADVIAQRPLAAKIGK